MRLGGHRLLADLIAHPVSRLAQLVLAVLIVTCTFVTTERGMAGDRRYPIMLGLLGGAFVACLLLTLAAAVLRHRSGEFPRGWRAAAAAAGPFVAVLVWAAITVPMYPHSVLVRRGDSSSAMVVPPVGLIVPLAEALLAVVVAGMLVVLIGRSRLQMALWETFLVLAVVTPADLVREYTTEPPVGWRIATRFGGAAIYHTVLLLGVGVMVDAIRRRYRVVLSWLSAASMVGCLIASGSRAGFIDLGLFCVALLIWGRPRGVEVRRRHLVKVIVGSVVAGAAVLWLGRLRGVGLVDRDRSQTWGLAWRALTESPMTMLFGRGYGVMWPWFANESGMVPGAYHGMRDTQFGTSLPHAHNTLVQIGAELGVLGVVLFLTSVVVIVVASLRAVGGPHGATSLALLATFPGLLLDTYLVKNFPTSLLWWVVAISMVVLMSRESPGGGSSQSRPRRGADAVSPGVDPVTTSQPPR